LLDLRSWIEGVREMGLLREITGASCDLEIGVLTEVNAKRNRYTLLFDEIEGYRKGFRVLTGALIDAKRVAHTFGFPPPSHDLELVKAFKSRLPSIGREAADYPPEFVPSAPVMENVLRGEEARIDLFPAVKWHEYDGGRYIGTADCVITKDPETGWINVGTYRVMVHNSRELGVFIDGGHHAWFHIKKYFERGEPCPVVISLGHHPLLFAVSGLEVPFGVSEYNYAGALLGSRYRVVKGEVTGLPIPADSEVAVEGYILPEVREEGPFGEFMGYYAGGVMRNPVIRIEAIYHRDDPIILGTAPGRPPYDYSYYRCPIRAAMIWDVLEKAGIPNIEGVWCHEEGYSRAFTVVSIKQAYAGHARQAGYVAAMCSQGTYGGRFVVVVDDDIDPTNIHDVLWAMCSRTEVLSSIEIIRESWDTPLDPIVEKTPDMQIGEFKSARALIFACWPYSWILRGKVPRTAESSPETRRRFIEKWKDLLSLT